MAGIGFSLERLARTGGVGGIAGAAMHGAVITSGPWLMTICAVALLQRWASGTISPGGFDLVQTTIVYTFSAAVVIASPLAILCVRMASDRMFAEDRAAIPGLLLAALTWATLLALLAGTAIFGLAAALPPEQTVLATAILTLLCQITIASPLLAATRRHWPILWAYASGIAAAALPILLVDASDPTVLLAAIAAGFAMTLLLLLATIVREFPAAAAWPDDWAGQVRPIVHVAAAGFAAALAVWTDKWLLWLGPDSAATLGPLRLNAINDQASFLGLLTIIPALTLILVVSEVRFERAFAKLMVRCTGTSKLDRIEEGRRDLVVTILLDLRLLIVVQALIATMCWVLAPEIFRVLGLDARGIFAFRMTAVGVVFHAIVIHVTTILSFYDLFGRILAIWTLFVAVSAIGTLAWWDLGFAGYGWGYLAGAVAAASLALALLAQATSQLTYLLFVRNNPAVVGEARYWV